MNELINHYKNVAKDVFLKMLQDEIDNKNNLIRENLLQIEKYKVRLAILEGKDYQLENIIRDGVTSSTDGYENSIDKLKSCINKCNSAIRESEEEIKNIMNTVKALENMKSDKNS